MKTAVDKFCWLYRSMYYRLYRYSERADGKYSAYHFNAAINFSMVLILNFSTLYGIYLVISGTKISILDVVPIWVVGAIGAGFGVLHTFLLGYKDRYKKIIKEFSKESREEEHRRNIWAVWYVVLSFLFSFGLAGGLTALKVM